MFVKKYFTIAKLILLTSMMFFMLSCDKTSSPTGGSSTGTVDAALVGVWFDVSDSTGSEIKSDGTIIPLQLDQNKFLVAINIGTETINLSASGGSFTLTRKTKVEGTSRDTTIVTNGTYTVTATTLIITDPSGTMTLKKSAYGVNVFTYTGGGGGGSSTAGTLAFSSDKGSFSANGVYNSNATSGTGAGAFLQSSGSNNMLAIYAFRVNSPTSFDITLIQFLDSSPISSGAYSFPPTSSSKMVMVNYFPNMNPNDTNNVNFYSLSTATANISALTTTNVQGTFSGSGMYYMNDNPNPSQTIALTGGTFNVPILPSGGLRKSNNTVEKIVNKILQSRLN